MYWDEDQYKSIDCNETLYSKQVIALNNDLLNNYKKIVCWNNLDSSSIGKVWYFKIKNEVQLFNGPGPHPEHKNMYARPLTKYMYNKYIVNKSTYNPCKDHSHS